MNHLSTTLLPITNPNNCSEFTKKTKRYSLALRKDPFARIMELLPLLYLLPSSKNIFLDLFAGTGFVSDFLSPFFKETVQVDEVSDLLKCYQQPTTSISGDALDLTVLSHILNKVDMATCFAGLHHVLGKIEGEIDKDETERLRISALSEWRKKLGTEGLLLVADVPLPDHNIYEASLLKQVPLSNIELTADFGRYLGEMLNDHKGKCLFPTSTLPDHLETYLANLMTSLAGLGWQDPDPANFFQSFVSRHSSVGHKGNFQTISNLVKCFKQAGFEKIGCFVAPTPWFFNNRRAAMWFINELFALSEETRLSPNELPKKEEIFITEAVQKHLGLADLPDGSCVIWWKLMYVWGMA